jgi:hypothetical protein
MFLLVAAAVVCAVLQFGSEDPLLRWRQYLERNDARLILAWTAALPLAVAIDAFRRQRFILSVAAGFAGIAAQSALFFIAPAEMERLFKFAGNPLTLVVAGCCAGFGLLSRFAPWFVGSGLGLFAFGAGLGVSVAAAAGWEGWIKLDLPPNYHDEYAYLFQAWTYLDGRFGYPVDELTPAFEQVHVLRSDVFASRYFPGTALWMLPFVAAGKPIVSMWVAHGIATGFFALVAARFHRAAGWPAALLVATAPAMIAFSDALLSTMPTMAAVGVFLWAWTGSFERRGAFLPIVAGLAIGFAFITRPMSAVGVGFPFAMYSLWCCRRPREVGLRRKIVAMIAAFAVAASALPISNYGTLGNAVETPYSRYTRTVTPSHVYGFYNQERGQIHRTSDSFLPYDAWATNLTPKDALPTLRARIDDALREGVGGRLFAAFFLIASLALLHWSDDRSLLLWLSVVGLALAYTPYWFVGVLGYGYFAEALPLLLLLVSLAAVRMATFCTAGGWPALAAMWPALVILRALTNVGDVVPASFTPGSDSQFARREKKQVVDHENRALQQERGPILVLVLADPQTAVHSTLVNNHPRLDAPVVRAWGKPEYVDKLLARFPDRAVYVLDYKGFAEPFGWRRLRPAQSR